jgi:hypothetical protein
VGIELIDIQSIAPDGIRNMKHCIRACALNKVSTDDFERVNSCLRLVAILCCTCTQWTRTQAVLDDYTPTAAIIGLSSNGNVNELSRADRSRLSRHGYSDVMRDSTASQTQVTIVTVAHISSSSRKRFMALSIAISMS